MSLKRYIFKKQFQGNPKLSDFELVQEPIREPEKDEVLFEAVYWSVDPYMRVFAPNVTVGQTMFGTQVARVVKSKHSGYKEGQHVVGHFGWCTHITVNPDRVPLAWGGESKVQILPDFGEVPLSHALGAVGMPGNSALFGLTKICEPKKGETLVVTGAAGAVGSLVGQIGKILGLRVIGFAGSDKKVKMLKEELGFDAAFNYKKVNITEALKESAPKGVDCYFDNVGGLMSHEIMCQMNTFGRVSVCGSISSYNSDPKNPPLVPILQPLLNHKQLRIEGFIVSRWDDIWDEGLMTMLQYIREGKIKCKETIEHGFHKIPETFFGLFEGENVGKAIIKA